MHKLLSEPSNKKIGNVIKTAFIGISIVLIIVSIVITVGEICIAYYNLSGDSLYSSVAPIFITLLLIIVQFVGIVINFVLKKWLKTRSLLNEKNMKLGSMPIWLLFFNLLLALILALIVNISNGNIVQLINRMK
jgi:hypothetical protein